MIGDAADPAEGICGGHVWQRRVDNYAVAGVASSPTT